MSHTCPTLTEVSVDIVGKYSYKMQSAHPDAKLEVPVIVDVELVGRTKVLRIHRWVRDLDLDPQVS